MPVCDTEGVSVVCVWFPHQGTATVVKCVLLTATVNSNVMGNCATVNSNVI